MIDMNALIARLQAAGASPEAIQQLMASVESNPASSARLTPETRSSIERAAAAMQAGDFEAAKAAAARLMETPDGANLTNTILGMIGK